MNIIILQGSPNRRGSTFLLADAFRQGAEEAGHKVELIDLAHADIHPCTGCVRCGYEGPCVQKDDVEAIRAKVLATDLELTAQECAWLEEPYIPHALVGVMAQNTPAAASGKQVWSPTRSR